MNLKSILLVVCLTTSALAADFARIANPLVDFAGHKEAVLAVEKLRRTRVVSEAEFLCLAREPGTVVLDARSAAMFQRLHLKGAVNLSFPDFTAETLARVIPQKTTRVLIYCNNNFNGSPVRFPPRGRKLP